MKNRSIYKRKSGGIALLVRNRILNMVKIVKHVDFQRRIEKSLHNDYYTKGERARAHKEYKKKF